MVLPVLPYREPEVVHSCGELDRIFKKEQIGSASALTVLFCIPLYDPAFIMRLLLSY